MPHDPSPRDAGPTWTGLIQRWRSAGLDVAQIVALLQASGFEHAAEADCASQLAACLAEPVNDYDGEKWRVLGALFSGERLHVPHVRSDDFSPRHDVLFQELCALVKPAVLVDAVAQVGVDEGDWEDVAGPHALTMQLGAGRTTRVQRQGTIRRQRNPRGRVSYVRDGNPEQFEFDALGTWMDLDAVLGNTNALLQRLDHPQRIFQFSLDDTDNPEFPVLIAGDALGFPTLCARLGLPLAAH